MLNSLFIMKRTSLLLLFVAIFIVNVLAIDIPGKQIYIPSDLRNNNFESDTAQWSYSRMALTENFVIFWQRGFGADLKNPPQLEGHRMSVDLENLKQKLERFYAYYRDTLHFIGAGSNADRYRMMVMINYSLDGTAYGGDYDEVIGAFWAAPNRLQDRPLNAVAHELGHSFQMQVHCDKKAKVGRASNAYDQFIDTQDAERPEEGRWFGGGFFEMTSQWMLWHVNPNWVRDELYHWTAYQRTPHKAYLHWENVYHSPYVLEWWSQNHGLYIIGDIYKTAHNPEDPADAFMRLTKMNVNQFNDDLFEANRHTVFLDFKHAFAQTRPYAGKWPQLNVSGAPEEGGFDARLMPTPSRGERLTVDFKGDIQRDIDGWRYGFVAQMSDGSCRYSPIYKESRAKISFTAPQDKDVRELYLVVMGAPSQRRTAKRGETLTFPYHFTTTSSRQLVSPNGRLVAQIGMQDGQVCYTLSVDGKCIVEKGLAAMNVNGKTEKPSLRLLRRETRQEHIDAFAYRQKAFDVTYNLEHYRLTSALDMEFRVYDDGLAYRFVQTNRKPLVVDNETFAITPVGDPKTYAAYSTKPEKPEAMAFQNIYTFDALSHHPAEWAFLPVTFDFGAQSGVKLTLLEADLEAYPGMFVSPQEGRVEGRFAHYPKRMDYYRYRGMSYVAETEAFIAKTQGQRTFPWRVLCVTTDDCQMPTSNLVYALAAPNRIGDTAWIHGGKSAWDWWHDWNLKGVPFKAGINLDTYKYYIDFAAKYGLQYAILDEGWYDSNKGEIMQSIPDINVQELVDYGRQKGVGIILWTVFNVLDEHLEEACEKYAKMGVKGFKVDFLDRDDQTAVEMAYRIAEACARHHLMLDYHGFWKPTGMNRTYPNVVNFESVFGMEEVKWNADKKDMPLYDVTFPFIRGMCGPVDFTPGAMRNASLKDFRDVYDHPMSMGTRCHQLAHYVVHDSPLTMLADAATSYEAEPDYTRFLASIPNEVDETRVIAGKLGEYIVVARRSQGGWWIGAQTNWNARDLELNLVEALGLDRASAWKAVVYADGPNAEKNAEDYQVSVVDERKALQSMKLHLASGGGCVIHLQGK